MNFFIDNNLPPSLARAINELCRDEHTVIHLKDKFDQSTPDTIWIEELATEKEWIVVTQDRLAKGDLEKEAVRRSGLTIFILARQWTKMEFWDQAHRLVQWWPRVIEQAEMVEAGAAFEIPCRAAGPKARFKTKKI